MCPAIDWRPVHGGPCLRPMSAGNYSLLVIVKQSKGNEHFLRGVRTQKQYRGHSEPLSKALFQVRSRGETRPVERRAATEEKADATQEKPRLFSWSGTDGFGGLPCQR